MRIKFPLLIIACCLLLMACSHKTSLKNYQAYYSFNNVTTSSQEKQLAKDLRSKGIPTKNWDTLEPYISHYNQENTGMQPVVKKWTQSKIGKDKIQFVTSLNEKTVEDNKSHFTDDLNYRQTSFLLLHSLMTSSSDLTKRDLPLQNEYLNLKSRHKDLTAKDQALYSLLFGDNPNYQSTDDLLKAWKKAGLKFPEKVKLLSVFQNSSDDVSNIYTAIAYEKDGSVYVFEKQDPTLPYRWSRFNTWADVKIHWLSNRFKVFKENIDILVNDQKFDDFLKDSVFIPKNNQLVFQE